jgi:glycosyltransferase involved in cell wall biosynthesis
MKVLHCPTNVGGNAWGLSRAERKLGLQSDLMVYRDDWLRYPADIDLQLSRNRKVRSALTLTGFFFNALVKYDVFHFNFGSSLVPFGIFSRFELTELALLRSLGKKIVVTYQGCDARQADYCREHFRITCCNESDCYGGQCNENTDAVKRRRIGKFGRYAHKIFSLNPDLLWVLPAGTEFMPYASVDLNDWVPSQKKSSLRKKITILHAPTERGVKGTKYIIEAVNKLKQTHDIDLVLVEQIPHDKVKELYQQADLAIDQLLCGWYGGFAVEMMALGKPVVCYIRQEDLSFLPAQMKHDMPIINADPHNIYEVLLNAVEERGTLALIGEKGRAFVERWHDPIKIARRTKEVYESL